MKVLVTGASGLMGRAVAGALIERGDEVTVMQRRSSGLDCREVLGDIVDEALVRKAAAGQQAVLHLAAKVDVVGRWAQYARINIEGTRTVVQACRGAGVERLVNISSPSVAHAGTALMGVGAAPADPSAARSHYSRSKAVAEQIALAADGAALAVLCLRPHLVWGPGDTQLIQPVVQRARAGRLPLIGTGAALVDTTYIDNATDAMVAAVDRCGVVHGQALVVSNGEPRTVSEILARVCIAAGVRGPRRRVPLPVAAFAGSVVEMLWCTAHFAGQPPITRFLAEQLGTAHWFDQRRTRELLDWTPRVGLDQGFELLAAGFDAT